MFVEDVRAMYSGLSLPHGSGALTGMTAMGAGAGTSSAVGAGASFVSSSCSFSGVGAGASVGSFSNTLELPESESHRGREAGLECRLKFGRF